MIAGFHDLRSPAVGIGAMASALTSKHEGFHDELFFHTSFGSLQQNLARALHELSSEPRHEKLFDSWVRLTLEESLTAHETYATYLSVKSFAQSEESALLARHPRKYRKYFDNLASRIDRTLKSSYLQFLVGKALVTAAFSSDVKGRVCSREELEAPRIYDHESPDRRLRTVLASYARVFLQPVHEAIDDAVSELLARDRLPAGFVPYSESSWTSLRREQSVELEKELITRLYAVVFPLVDDALELPIYDYSRTESDTTKLIELLLVMTNHSEIVTTQKVAMTEEKLKRSRLAEIQIANEAVAPDHAWTRIDGGDLHRHLRAGNVAITKELYASRDDVEWRLLVFRGDGISRYAMSDETLVRALNLFRPVRLAEGSLDVLENVVFGVRSLQAFPDVYERYEDTIEHAEHVTRFDSVFWYMGGNYVEWVDLLLTGEEPRIYVNTLLTEGVDRDLYLRAHEDGRLKLPREQLNAPDMPPRLVVMKGGIWRGYHVRLIPGYEATKLLGEVIPPDISRFEEDERRYLRAVSPKILNALFSAWRKI